MRCCEARSWMCQACRRALMISHNFRAASSQFTGLMRTASNALLASVARVPKSRRPVHANKAVWRVAGSARKASATTNPSRPGMRRSQSTASGTSCVARKTPRQPGSHAGNKIKNRNHEPHAGALFARSRGRARYVTKAERVAYLKTAGWRRASTAGSTIQNKSRE